HTIFSRDWSSDVCSSDLRINAPALDSFSAGCLQLQNDADRLIAEYKSASMARREAILQQLRNIGSDWINIGCKAVFGSIALTLPDRKSVGQGREGEEGCG